MTRPPPSRESVEAARAFLCHEANDRADFKPDVHVTERLALALDSFRASPAGAPTSSRPEIVCLCGSTRFMDAYAEHYGRLTDEGKIVLTVGRVVPQSEQALGSSRKVALDELHKRKIDLADSILVLNVGGYIGPSTSSEIEYATARGKRIAYLEAKVATSTPPASPPAPSPSPDAAALLALLKKTKATIAAIECWYPAQDVLALIGEIDEALRGVAPATKEAT